MAVPGHGPASAGTAHRGAGARRARIDARARIVGSPRAQAGDRSIAGRTRAGPTAGTGNPGRDGACAGIVRSTGIRRGDAGGSRSAGAVPLPRRGRRTADPGAGGFGAATPGRARAPGDDRLWRTPNASSPRHSTAMRSRSSKPLASTIRASARRSRTCVRGQLVSRRRRRVSRGNRKTPGGATRRLPRPSPAPGP